MDLLTILVVVVIVGVLLWAVNMGIPMQPQVKNIFNVIVIVALVLWLLYQFLPAFTLRNVGQ